MNKLSIEAKTRILGCLTEGMSIRATCRVTGADKGTVSRLIREVGAACEAYQRRWLIDLTCNNIQCDEIWSFCNSKQRNVRPEKRGILGFGSVWNFVAICRDCKLIPVWLVGQRTVEDARALMQDLRFRLRNKTQLSTDALAAYSAGVVSAFRKEDVDYATIEKHYAAPRAQNVQPDTRYSPARLTGVTKRTIIGNPNEKMICTSHIERANLTIRMQNRRFTRLTNAHSKRIEMHRYSLAITFFHYNFIRKHQSLGGKTPAMAAGVADHPFTLRDMLFAADQSTVAA